MNFDKHTIVRYLLKQKLVNKREIVNDDLKIFEIFRKNMNLKIIRESGMSYVIKQSFPSDEFSKNAIHNESKFYSLIQNYQKMFDIQEIIPKLIKYDKKNNVLILELLDNTTSAFYASNEPDEYYTNFLSLVALNIAKLHKEFIKFSQHKELFSFLPMTFPSSLYAICPKPEIFALMSQGSMEFLIFMQNQPKFIKTVTRLRDNWKCQTMIHGDLKPDNILISNIDGHETQIKIIDWEMTDLGDAAWDIGSFFYEILYGLFQDMYSDSTSKSNLLQKITKKSKQYITIFWNAYVNSVGVSKFKDEEFLERCICYMGLKFIQTSFDSLELTPVMTREAKIMGRIGYEFITSPKVYSGALINEI